MFAEFQKNGFVLFAILCLLWGVWVWLCMSLLEEMFAGLQKKVLSAIEFVCSMALLLDFMISVKW